MVYNFFDKKTAIGAVKKNKMQNKELAVEFHKPILRKFEKQRVNSSFIDNIWGPDLVDMKLLSKVNIVILFFFIFIVNMLGLLLWKIKKVLQLLMLFKIF